MLRHVFRAALAAFLLAGTAGPAWAEAEDADPGQVRLTPLLDARLRYENVDQPSLDAEALTLRLRAGAQAALGRFTLLAEAEATVAPVDGYNAFPFPLPGEGQSRPDRSVVADPENLELNRLQLQYRSEPATVTLGRQRINLDDQRWVGSVGWRQNEQTFDALRAEAQLGPVALDLAYAISQRTIFGEDAGPRTAQSGDFLFGGASARLGPVQGKLFAYLLDYDEAFALANSSQTYGLILATSLPVAAGTQLALRASHARQSDLGANPFDYAASYWSFDAATQLAGFQLAAGWERLGSDNGRGVQTPAATLHKFNGWADIFLVTPPSGLDDAWVSVGRRFDGIEALPGLNASLVFHQFDGADADVEYGTEWDASIGFRIRRVGILLKYADYDSAGFGADTRKLWLQAEWSF